jgi:hypothetical protein
MTRLTILGFLVALISPALGADSIVLARALSNSYAASVPCPEDEICLDVLYRWAIDPKRTVAGPKIKGRIEAIRFQHVGVNDGYLKSLHLFVLRPIGEVEVPHPPNVTYYLVSSSPIYDDGNYCISVDPKSSGLHLKNVVAGNDGDFCFDHKLLQ